MQFPPTVSAASIASCADFFAQLAVRFAAVVGECSPAGAVDACAVGETKEFGQAVDFHVRELAFGIALPRVFEQSFAGGQVSGGKEAASVQGAFSGDDFRRHGVRQRRCESVVDVRRGRKIQAAPSVSVNAPATAWPRCSISASSMMYGGMT